MKRLLLSCTIFFSVLLSHSIKAQEHGKHISKDSETIEIIMAPPGDSLKVINAEVNDILEIYNVLGVKVLTIKLESNSQTIPLNLPKGCYIVKIKDVARKIAVK